MTDGSIHHGRNGVHYAHVGECRPPVDENDPSLCDLPILGVYAAEHDDACPVCAWFDERMRRGVGWRMQATDDAMLSTVDGVDRTALTQIRHDGHVIREWLHAAKETEVHYEENP